MNIYFKASTIKNCLKPRLLLACLLAYLTFLPATAYALRDDVLVIVNDNSIDSPLIGAYYAQQRNINPANILHVRIRNGYFIAWDEFRSLRDQIIAFMQTNTLDDPGLTPAACVDGELPYYCPASMLQLRQHTKIRYLVTTRGIPTRMTVSGSRLFAAAAPTSVDNYLKYWLINYFAADVNLRFPEREKAFLDGRGMRTVVPSVDKELIVGRIDGLNQEAALNLVDRAIQAEQNGLYGNLISHTQFQNWLDHSVTGFLKRVYLPLEGPQQTWRYQMGLFGEPRFECRDYLNFPLTTLAGLAPVDCKVQITPATETGPGNSLSREPIVNDALMYFGWLDGSVSASNFNGLLNWRKQPSCKVLLCENSSAPDACRAASTDVYREINTQCVGLADGFIGYNHQSYPLSFLASWPSGWYPDSSTTNWNAVSGGDSLKDLAFPEISENYGLLDLNSLWFRSSDQVAAPVCYTDNSFTATAACPDQRRINLNQKITFPEKLLDAANPASFRITFWYRTFNVTTATDLQARLFVHESGAGSQQIDYGIQTIGNLPVGNGLWHQANVTFTLDPALHGSQLYDGIKLRLQSSGLFAGELVMDIVSITDLETNQNLAQNGFFSGGHKQVAMGDYAASFLSRLNGTAFLGSVSHHQSGGAAFAAHQLETLVYFMRGLPLGDAVWFNESNNSGILYGDPLYSPVAVYLHPVNVDDNLQGSVGLIGDVVNGQAPAFVNTQYAIDYCAGTDFYVCDLDPFAWFATGISGSGGQKNQPLGVWDTALMMPGSYVLRLAVTSTNLTTGKSQTFYDYYPVTVGTINSPPAPTAPMILINEDTSGSSQILVNDPDIGDTHSFAIIFAPLHGTATVSASGLVSYSPFANQNGRDGVIIAVTDSAGNTANVNVPITINPVNDAPLASAAAIVTDANTSANSQILVNDPDVGDSHTYSVTTLPLHGTALVSVTGLVFYTPATDYHGADQLAVTVSDAAGASVDVLIDITVNSVIVTYTLQNNSSVVIEGTIEEIPASGWLTILGKPIYMPLATITYKSNPGNPVLNIGDHVRITTDTVWSYLIARTVVRDNAKTKFSVTGPASYLDPDNKRLGIGFINVQADANTNFQNFNNSLNPIASITANMVLTADAQALQPDGSFVAKNIRIN